MYRRLIVLSAIILAALCGLAWLGYRSIEIRAQGLEGGRLGEFAAVAEQIRQDVKRKLDEFMQTEQNRPYSDYQYYYVPENVAPGQQQMPLLRSPLAGRLENDFAYGNFQIEPDGRIVTPYYRTDQSQTRQMPGKDELSNEARIHLNNIRQNLLPALTVASGAFRLPSREYLPSTEINEELRSFAKSSTQHISVANIKETKKQQAKSKLTRAKEYPIQSLQKDSQKKQVLTQQRSVVASNVAQDVEPASQSAARTSDGRPGAAEPQTQTTQMEGDPTLRNTAKWDPEEMADLNDRQPGRSAGPAEDQLPLSVAGDEPTSAQAGTINRQMPQRSKPDIVEISIDPFVPVVVPGGQAQQSIFRGQVFLLRHVQIEDRHFLQGFQLNEKKLIEEVEESAERFMREGMEIELAQTEDEESTYTAILDFGFGNLLLNLKEIDPAWISNKINWLRNWYFTIIAIVLLAVTLGLASLWRNARAHIKLAQKKDDFISAVSHELRTPLTSIRMYSEMLEKNWVKSKDKLAEYYRNMHQESERLSRLIENVLDFSRIQRGQKKYTFSLGDINECIADVVEMMTPYAAQSGFSIKMEPGQLEQTAFDGDAVTQIVVNLLDNAIKYARDAEDKTITVRTRTDEQFILIEVEDHGPGVPHRQQKKIFEEFYRSGAEATRETTGTGLGLALVKKFAQAHNGFVEIITAKPTGAIFRVALAAQM